MTATFDPGTDFEDVVDHFETVTLRRPGTLDTSITHALRRAVTVREAQASGGKYTASDVRWHFPEGELSGPPMLGDKIIDGQGSLWTVLEFKLATLGARWECVTRNVSIAEGLGEKIDIQQATWTKGSAGAATATWNTQLSQIPARIQSVEVDVQSEHQQRLAHATHQIFLAEQITIDENHRVIGPDQSVYHVVRFEKAQRIDELSVIFAVKTPWPLG